jgi:hypothetical protein
MLNNEMDCILKMIELNILENYTFCCNEKTLVKLSKINKYNRYGILFECEKCCRSKSLYNNTYFANTKFSIKFILLITWGYLK